MGMNTTATEYYGLQEYRELLAQEQADKENFDAEFPFDPSVSSEPIAEFKPVFCDGKIRGISDVDLFRMFNVVVPTQVSAVRIVNGKKVKGKITVERPIFKVSKNGKYQRGVIAQAEKDAKAKRLEQLAAWYQNPENEGLTPIDSFMEAVEDGRDFQVTPVMLAIVAAQDAADEDAEDE